MSENEETKIEEEKQTDKKKKFIPKMYDKVKDALKKKTPLTDALKSGNAKVFNSMDEYKKHLKLRTEKKEKLKNIAGLGVGDRQTHFVKDDNLQNLVYGTDANSVAQRIRYAENDPDFYSKLPQYGGNANQREFDMFTMWKKTGNPIYKPAYLQEEDTQQNLKQQTKSVNTKYSASESQYTKNIQAMFGEGAKLQTQPFTDAEFKEKIHSFFYGGQVKGISSTTPLSNSKLQSELKKYLLTIFDGALAESLDNDEMQTKFNNLYNTIIENEKLFRQKNALKRSTVSTGTNNAENQAGTILEGSDGKFIMGADGKYYKIVE